MVLRFALCLAACVALCTAARPFPGSPEETNLFQQFLESLRSRVAAGSSTRAVKGDDACDREVTLTASDRISQKFYDDHICLIRGAPPKDLNQFCRDFRQLDLYHVLLINPTEIKRLRNDIGNHQIDFYDNREHYPPIKRVLPSTMHFYSTDTFNMIECNANKGKKLSGRYQVYVPKGTAGNPKGNYQIYHGCAPSRTRPGFSVAGEC